MEKFATVKFDAVSCEAFLELTKAYGTAEPSLQIAFLEALIESAQAHLALIPALAPRKRSPSQPTVG